MKLGKLGRYAGILLVLLLINTAYIAAFASPTIFYMGNVVLHLALGVALAIMLLWFIRRMPVAGSLFLIAALAGVFLAVRGNTTPHRWVLQAHIAVAALALLAPAGVLPRRNHALPKILSEPRRSNPEPLDRASLHERGGRRSALAVLS